MHPPSPKPVYNLAKPETTILDVVKEKIEEDRKFELQVQIQTIEYDEKMNYIAERRRHERDEAHDPVEAERQWLHDLQIVANEFPNIQDGECEEDDETCYCFCCGFMLRDCGCRENLGEACSKIQKVLEKHEEQRLDASLYYMMGHIDDEEDSMDPPRDLLREQGFNPEYFRVPTDSELYNCRERITLKFPY